MLPCWPQLPLPSNCRILPPCESVNLTTTSQIKTFRGSHCPEKQAFQALIPTPRLLLHSSREEFISLPPPTHTFLPLDLGWAPAP